MMRARARHILVPTRETCEQLKQDIMNGQDFAEVAAAHSTCPSGRRGGDLGTFGKEEMVPEFEEVVFTGDVGVVHGPVQTQFGFHLIEVTERTE
ncbi:peptidylprolyl isomerase [Desulfoplanes formicivorans]|uniref:Peptidyl-prolyl cis-trans isomerase C n=1 Tax=Desulfoplanes formicivorans TaxID=1592317 RepID=A0A194AEB5_9BACT|nr:peptidylprolyl isomerase [Desulfoplanes formicivorans]GAU07461.1 peptidyl-prolyl cis-trans isomerase [Desulfoplanes formicivorans]